MVLTCVALLASTSNSFANSFVRFDYNLFSGSRARGTVFLETFDDRPITSANFLTYVNNGAYDTTLMHRMVRDFVIQGGGFEADQGVYVAGPPFPYIFPIETDQDGNPNTDNPTIVNEFNNSPMRSNVKGTLAMAKLPPTAPGGGPNSASSEYFFNMNNNAGTCPNGLDCQNGGFTVFAQVVGDGMLLMDAYNAQLNILNLNPDSDADGMRESSDGPFSSLPAVGSSANNYIPLVLLNADQIDYLGNGLLTTIPAGGLTFSTRDAFIDTGTSFTGTGELIVGANRKLGVREGNVLAARSLRNLGTVEPGLEVGQVSLQSFRQDIGAHLAIDINGTTVDTHYDRLAVSGAALLGGDLDVSLINYNPIPGNSFTVLTAGLITGNFDEINLPQLTAGYVWSITKTNTSLTLTVNGGDYNRDGIVNAADYVMWRKLRNTSVPKAFDLADGNGDKAINDLDYQVFFKNLGNVRGGSPGSGGFSDSPVPEPSAALLLLLALPFVGQRRARKSA
jgi:cyclophilin family peptidyl-prolyl cis-trans isomerase